MNAMAHPIQIVWPSWATQDLWRWLMLAFGFALVVRGLLSKNVRIRDSRTLGGWWRGKVAAKPWQIVYMRSLLVLIGVGFISFALTFGASGH
jgi:hypothetical protein